MTPETQREMVVQALIMGALFGLILMLWTRDPAQVVVAVPVFSLMMYASYWVTNRFARRFGRRLRPEPPEPIEPSSERPEHAQRRRSRRRRRGRRVSGPR